MRKENINILHMAKISQLRYTIFILRIKWNIYFSIFHFLQYLIFIFAFLYPFYISALFPVIIPILLHAKAREWRDVEQTRQNDDGQSTKLPDAIVPRDNRHAQVSLESIGTAR